jgi:hypothetical protein
MPLEELQALPCGKDVLFFQLNREEFIEHFHKGSELSLIFCNKAKIWRDIGVKELDSPIMSYC